MLPSARELRIKLVALAIFYALAGIVLSLSYLIPEDGAVDDFLAVEKGAETAIDLVKEILTLAVTLIIATYAGAGVLVYHWLERSRRVAWFEAGFILAVLVAGAATLYGVLLSYNAMLSFAAAQAFVPTSTEFTWGLWITYYGLIFSVLMMASAFISSLVPILLGVSPGRDGH